MLCRLFYMVLRDSRRDSGAATHLLWVTRAGADAEEMGPKGQRAGNRLWWRSRQKVEASHLALTQSGEVAHDGMLSCQRTEGWQRGKEVGGQKSGVRAGAGQYGRPLGW